MTVRIINADVMEGLRQLPDESVHCVVTSPPYWGLRDYGVDGQIGQEPTFGEFLDRMVEVFREVRRVLRKDGTCWVNMGDSYCSTDKWGGGKSGNAGKQTVAADGTVPSWAVRSRKAPIEGIKPKDLMMQPARLALALQADGWWLRKEIIWHKPNPMPESCIDRPTSSHEKVYLLTKSERYAYDAYAVREGRTSDEDANGFRGGSYVAGEPGPRTAVGNKRVRKNGASVDRRKHGFQDRWDSKVRGLTPRHEGHINHTSLDETPRGFGRNLRDVWTIATAPFPEAHFATFPPELPEICIKAGCPKGGGSARPVRRRRHDWLSRGSTAARRHPDRAQPRIRCDGSAAHQRRPRRAARSDGGLAA